MELLDVGRIVLGVVLLVGGGELLVRGASSLAARAGMSSLVVGLTVVAAATSAPELAVTTGAVLDGETALAIGNVVGSNIANVLLILGISALAAPLVVRRVLVRIDAPVLLGLSLVTLLLSLDGTIGRADGLLLLALLVAHAVLAVVVSRRESRTDEDEAEDGAGRHGVLLSVVLVAAGVGLLVLGARVLVDGAVSIATGLGVSGLVVGLTVVAIGTSLPELATSVIATIRGERDLAVGNIVGSCIFNLGLVLGLPALLSPDGGLAIPAAALALDLPLMIATALALVPVAFTGYRVGRREGGLFLAMYAAYLGYVVLDATSHDALEGFTSVMALFVLPLVGLTLFGAVAYDLGRRRERGLAAQGGGDPG